jgi:hypothetical protein
VSAAGAAGAVSTTGAVAGVSSTFLVQAARATAIRETISRDFFMGFPFLIQSKYFCVAMNNYR